MGMIKSNINEETHCSPIRLPPATKRAPSFFPCSTQKALQSIIIMKMIMNHSTWKPTYRSMKQAAARVSTHDRQEALLFTFRWVHTHQI